MPKHSLDKDIKKAIFEARSWVEAIAKADSNEAETRKRIDHILGACVSKVVSSRSRGRCSPAPVPL